MSPVDLGTSSGFLLATSGAAMSAFSLLGYDPSEWDLIEGSYNGVVFHVFSRKNFITGKGSVPYEAGLSRVTDVGGRRKARYVFPYQDGQLLDDLGRTPETFTFEILLYGPNYLTGLNLLMKQLQLPFPGLLIHPVRGEIRCAMESFELLHASETRNAVALRLTMIESNIGSITYSRTTKPTTFQAALAAAASALGTLTRIAAKIQQAAMFYTGLTSMCAELVATYQEQYGAALAAINYVFNEDNVGDLVNILPTNGTDTVIFKNSLSPNDPYADVDFESLSKETVKAIAVQGLENVLDNLRQEVNILSKTLSVLTANALSLPPAMSFYLGRTPSGRLIFPDQTTIASETVNRMNSSPGTLANIPDSDGALEFAEEIKQLRDTILSIQKAYDLGMQANRTRIVNYTCPRDMSIREIAHALGVDFDKLNEIDALNPELDSVNLIAKNTVVVVPV